MIKHTVCRREFVGGKTVEKWSRPAGWARTVKKVEQIDTQNRSAILKMTGYMAAPAPIPAPPLVEPVNALDLSSRMGLSIELLARAIGADARALTNEPRGQQWQSDLLMMAELWQELLILFGTEENARLFLASQRPEIRGRTGISYLEEGRPKVVLNLVWALREMLP